MTAALQLPDDLPVRLRRELERTAPAAWRRNWTPELSYGRHGCRPRGRARQAAVAILLCRHGDQWAVPLTRRSERLHRHGGQISFPGGLIEAGEAPRAAAARELAEELGPSGEVEWLGELATLWVFASDTAVTPCIGWLPCWPRWEPNPAEVDRVLRLPAETLVGRQPDDRLAVARGPWQFTAPCLRVENEPVWGSTAILLGELQGRLRRLLGWPRMTPSECAEAQSVRQD